MSRKPTTAKVTLAILAAVVVFASWIILDRAFPADRENDQGATRTTDSSELRPRPDPKYFGTAQEIGTEGDIANPGALYGRAYPHDTDTRERHLGGLPIRFSGYTTWADRAELVPAARYIPGLAGNFVRVRVRIFNRDTKEQDGGAAQFQVWRKGTGYRHADVVTAPALLPGDVSLRSGKMLTGWVYLYVGDARGRIFLVYQPDEFQAFASDTTTVGIWQLTPATSAPA